MQMIYLTRRQVREIDRLSVKRYGIPSIILMENAARAVADEALKMLANVTDPSVIIFAGGGNNGGDGYAVARHLHNRGVKVEWCPTANPDNLKGDARSNCDIVRAMRLKSCDWESAMIRLEGGMVDLAIDAMLGTGLETPVRENDRHWIELLNEGAAPVLAVDLPSGLDCDSGEPHDIAVKATRTITFVAYKAGFANPKSKVYTGEITVGDIGCPRELIDEVPRLGP